MLSGCAAAGKLRVDGAGPPVQSVKAMQAVDLPLALNPGNIPAPRGLSDCLSSLSKGAPKSAGTPLAPSNRQPTNERSSTAPNKADASSGPVCAAIIASDDKGPSFWESTGLNDLFGLLDTGDAAEDRPGAGKARFERLRLEAALIAFYDPANNKYGSTVDRRTRLQARLISASDTNCGIFGETLYGTQALANFSFGTVATTLAGAGAIVTREDTARLLSGASGIVTGVRSEMNEDFFRRQWVEALLKAIESSRDKKRGEMAGRIGDPISRYPVEAAIADAIRYNNECSLVAGLKLVNQAVVIADDPAGMRAFRETYARAGFDAAFNISASSDSSRANRVLASGAVDPGAALVDINDEISRISLLASAPTDKAVKEGGQKMLGELYAKDDDALVLNAYLKKIEGYQTEAKELAAKLLAADSELKRENIKAQLKANEEATDVVRRSARELLASVEARITDNIRKAETPNTQ